MATRTAANLDYAEVNNCVNGVAGGTNQFNTPVSDGDTVILPAGSSSNWSTALSVNSNISIIGNGPDYGNVIPSSANATIINVTESQGRFLISTQNSSDNIFRVSGIVIDSQTFGSNTYVIQMLGNNVRHLVGGVPRGGYRLDNLRFRASTDTVVNTTIASGSGGQTLPQATISLASTAGFYTVAPPGISQLAFQITTGAGLQTVTYTGISGNNLTGCSGGKGLMTTGQSVTQLQTPLGSKLRFIGTPSPSYLSGSCDHCFWDFIPQTTGSECFEFSQPGSVDGSTPNAWGQYSWQIDVTPGGGFDFQSNTADHRMYFEDNIIHRSGAVFDSSLGGGIIVTRHNVVYGLVGSHGMESGNNMGPRHAEHYNNHIIGNVAQSTPPYVGMQVRGGSGILANNRFTGYGVSRSPYIAQLYRYSASGSAVCGNLDGTNAFDLNERGDHETTVAAGSNGQTISSLTGGNLSVASTTGFATSGNIYVNTTTGTQTVAYTGVSGGNTFTGCTSGGTGTVATGNPVVSPLSYRTFTFVPVSLQRESDGSTGSRTGVPAGAVVQAGTVYAQSPGGSAGTLQATVTKAGLQYILKGLTSSSVNQWAGFTLVNLATAPAESLLGQGVGTGPNAVSYAFIQSSAISGSDTSIVCQGAANGAFNLDPSTTLSGALTLPSATISVASTATFASSGNLTIGGQTVAYTGISGGNTFTGCTGGTGSFATNTAISGTSSGNNWVIRKIRTPFCMTGSGKLQTSLNGGDNKYGPALAFSSGSPAQRWDTTNGGQPGFGLWQIANYYRGNSNSGWTGVSNWNSTATQIVDINSILPGGTFNNTLSGMPNGPYPTPTPTNSNCRIGADWVAPGFPAFNTQGCETFNVGDNVDPNSFPATVAYGGVYPNSSVTGSVGTGKGISLSPSAIHFGNVNTNTGLTINLTIGNPGDTTTTVSNVVSSDPRFVPSTTSGTVGVGGSLMIPIVFTPVAVTSYSTTITVTSDAAFGPNTMTCDGAGTTPATKTITMPSPVSFGNVQAGKTVTTNVSIGNSGNSTLTVSSITGIPTGYSLSWASNTIPPTGSVGLVITFTATITGNQAGTITFVNNGTAGGNTLALSASVTSRPRERDAGRRGLLAGGAA